MKTIRATSRDTRGSVLVITLSVVAVAAIVLASYLIIVQAQTASVARSQSWNQLISVSEAGQEEGYALINQGMPNIIGAGHEWDWTNTTAGNGWIQSGTVYTLTRSLDNSSSYTVTVDISSGVTPLVTATATVPFSPLPWVFSAAGAPFMAAGGVVVGNGSTNSGATIGRRIQTQAALNPLFNAAVITKSNFNMNGNNCRIDSFNSADVTSSTFGQYDPTKFKANGILGTDSSVVGDVNLGNGNIYGKVYTGPGTSASSVQIGPNGAVGSAKWNVSNTGIQPGAWSGDFNVNIPDVPTPAFSASAPIPNATNSTITLNGGAYVLNNNANSAVFTRVASGNSWVISGPTTLWIQGSFSPANIVILPGASLTLYVGTATGSGDTLGLGGQAVINQPGLAQNMSIYGLPSLNSIDFTGNAGFVGTIYAPDADLKGNGGGNNVLDTTGAMILRSATLNGHWNFHYDENLTNAGPSRGWVVKSWTEKKYP